MRRCERNSQALAALSLPTYNNGSDEFEHGISFGHFIRSFRLLLSRSL